MNLIKGKGGKGGSGSVRTPKEAPDSLQSRAYARFIDLLSEGPIEGFCLPDGEPLVDARLKDPDGHTFSTGVIQFPEVDGYVIDEDGVISSRTINGVTEPIIDPNNNGRGYPSCYLIDTEPYLKCIISGAGKDGVIHFVTYPKTVVEQTALKAAYGGLPYSKIPIHPSGKIRGLYIPRNSDLTRTSGTGYVGTVSLQPPSVIGQSIYLDDRALVEAADLTPNFSDVEFHYRLGNATQDIMPGFQVVEEVVNAVNANVPIEKDDPWITEITDKEYDFLRINLVWPQGLYRQDTRDGDIEEIDSLTFYIKHRYRREGDPLTAWSGYFPFGQGNEGARPGYYVIKGKTMSEYEKSIESQLAKTSDGAGIRHSWEIVITRITEDDDSENNSNKWNYESMFQVGQLTGITDLKLQYPFSAMVGVQINAEQFSRIPTRAYRLRMVKLQMPSNYVPAYTEVEVTYELGSEILTKTIVTKYPGYNRLIDGTLAFEQFPNGTYKFKDTNEDELIPINQDWDGTFYESWSNNPAWIAYNICINTRWGLGGYINGANKWWFYSVGKYCDEVINTGYDVLTGSYSKKEPRFTCNVYFQTNEEAFRVLRDIATTFAGYVYYGAGQIIPVNDCPRPVRMQFTTANVENGLFNYRGTTRKVRHTVAVMKFNDPANKHKLSPVYHEDVEGILRYGIQFLEKTAFGCTSRGQARRLAKRILRQELSNTDTVSFVTGLAGSVLRPGDVFSVLDHTRSGYKFGGRISDIRPDGDVSIISVDRAIDRTGLSSNSGDYTLVVYRPTAEASETDLAADAATDGISETDISKLSQPQIIELTISAIDVDAFGRTSFKLTTQILSGVVVGSVWGLKERSFAPQYFSTIGVEEVEPHKFTVTGIEYHEAIYNEVDQDAPYDEEPINPNLDRWKETTAPRNLLLRASSLAIDGIRTFTLHISWTKPERGFAVAYEVWLRKGLGNYQMLTNTVEFSVQTDVLPDENYGVRVYALSIIRAKSQPASASLTITDDSRFHNAEMISGLEIRGQGNDNKFYTSHLYIDWRVNWADGPTDLQEITSVPPLLPPPIKEYSVDILDSSNELLVNRRVQITEFQLALDENLMLPSGPYRDLIIKVTAISFNGLASRSTSLRVINDSPVIPTGVTVENLAIGGYAQVTFPRSTSPDFGGFRVWMSLSNGFSPAEGNLIYEGTSNVTPPLKLGTSSARYYVKYAEFDLLANGVLDCNISTQAIVDVT